MLDKSITHGKEHRSRYYDSRRFDLSCRNHGGCPWCESGRLYKRRRDEAAAAEEFFEFLDTTDYPVVYQQLH